MSSSNPRYEDHVNVPELVANGDTCRREFGRKVKERIALPSRKEKDIFVAANTCIDHLRFQAKVQQATQPDSQISNLWRHVIYGATIAGSLQSGTFLNAGVGESVDLLILGVIDPAAPIERIRYYQSLFTEWIVSVASQGYAQTEVLNLVPGDEGNAGTVIVTCQSIRLKVHLRFTTKILKIYTFVDNGVYVYPWRKMGAKSQLEMFDCMYNDVCEYKKFMCRQFNNQKKKREEIHYFSNCVSASMMLLSTLYVYQSPPVCKDALLFMKAWNHGVADNLTSIAWTILAGFAYDKLQNSNYSAYDLVVKILEVLEHIGQCASRNQSYFIKWPFDSCHSNELYMSVERKNHNIYLCDFVILQNLGKDFKNWIELGQKAQELREMLSNDTLRAIDSALDRRLSNEGIRKLSDMSLESVPRTGEHEDLDPRFQWQFQRDDGTWEDYDSYSNLVIETTWKKGHRTVSFRIPRLGCLALIDVKSGMEVSNASKRAIHRTDRKHFSDDEKKQEEWEEIIEGEPGSVPPEGCQEQLWESLKIVMSQSEKKSQWSICELWKELGGMYSGDAIESVLRNRIIVHKDACLVWNGVLHKYALSARIGD